MKKEKKLNIRRNCTSGIDIHSKNKSWLAVWITLTGETDIWHRGENKMYIKQLYARKNNALEQGGKCEH